MSRCFANFTLSLESLTRTANIELTMFLALTSAARTSEIQILDIRFLVKHSTGYILYFRKNIKTSRQDILRRTLKLYPITENKNCVSVINLIYT